jgi:predicted nucleic acid-binding Zn ribbon protein
MTYVYKCDTCKAEREVAHGMKETPAVACESIACVCAPMRRMISGAPKFVLQGTGWARDGYVGPSNDAIHDKRF